MRRITRRAFAVGRDGGGSSLLTTGAASRERGGAARAARHVAGDRRQPRLALQREAPARRATARTARPLRHGRRPPAQCGVLPGAAHRGCPVAVPVRAVGAVPDRAAGPRPGLGSARLRGPRGPPARSRTARLVQSVPGRQPHRPRTAHAGPPRPPAPGLGPPVRRQALLQPRAAGGPRLRPGRDARRGAALPRRRCALRRLLLSVSGRRAALRRRRGVRAVRQRLREPGRLAAGQHRPAGLRDGRAARGRGRRAGRRVRFGVSPFAVWRNRGTDPQGSRTQAGVQTYDDLYADTRRWVREGWIDYIVPQVYWPLGFAAADYAELVPWWARTVDGTGVDLYIGEALYKAGDPAARRLEGPGRTLPPPHLRPRLSAGGRPCLLLGEGGGQGPGGRHGAGRARPLRRAARRRGGPRRCRRGPRGPRGGSAGESVSGGVRSTGRCPASVALPCRTTQSGPGDTIASCPSSPRTR